MIASKIKMIIGLLMLLTVSSCVSLDSSDQNKQASKSKMGWYEAGGLSIGPIRADTDRTTIIYCAKLKDFKVASKALNGKSEEEIQKRRAKRCEFILTEDDGLRFLGEQEMIRFKDLLLVRVLGNCDENFGDRCSFTSINNEVNQIFSKKSHSTAKEKLEVKLYKIGIFEVNDEFGGGSGF